MLQQEILDDIKITRDTGQVKASYAILGLNCYVTAVCYQKLEDLKVASVACIVNRGEVIYLLGID